MSNELDTDSWTIVVGFALVAGGGFIAAEKFTSTVTLGESEIRLRSGFAEKRLPIDKIRGRQRYYNAGDGEAGGEWRLKIVSDDDRFPTLDFGEQFNFDDAFRTWFSHLPDLDEADKTKPKTSNFGFV